MMSHTLEQDGLPMLWHQGSLFWLSHLELGIRGAGPSLGGKDAELPFLWNDKNIGASGNNFSLLESELSLCEART